MDKFLIRPGSAKQPEESQKNDEQDKGKKKQKKQTVQKQPTIQSWGLDWLETEGGPGGIITVHCKACRAFPTAGSCRAKDVQLPAGSVL